MEHTTITKEDILSDLKQYASYSGTPEKEAEYLEKTKLPKEIAAFVFAAYTKGIDIYFQYYIEEKGRAEKSESKYTKLAIKLADQMIEE